jgi:hypothetical protein
MGKPEGKKEDKIMWLDTIKMDLGEKGWGGMVCIGLAQDRDQLL